MNRVHSWTMMNKRDSKTQPTMDVREMEFNLYTNREYKLPAITLWLRNEFRKQSEMRLQ
jgi:hypothetical protein